jgi:hypothetical protein
VPEYPFRFVYAFIAAAAMIALFIGSDAVVRGQTNPTLVLYPGGGAVAGAHWRVVADAHAAAGSAIGDTDRGEPKILAPLASPASYAELAFTAPANVTYHLWLRMRAQGNSYTNDSVHVQFSDSVNRAGAAAYRIGTSDSLAVVLENGSGAGVSDWGWADDSYGSLGTTLKFASSGARMRRARPEAIRRYTRQRRCLNDGRARAGAPYCVTSFRNILRTRRAGF